MRYGGLKARIEGRETREREKAKEKRGRARDFRVRATTVAMWAKRPGNATTRTRFRAHVAFVASGVTRQRTAG